MIQLSPDQTKAYDAIMAWYHKSDRRDFTLAGYAGTGKTTLLQVVAAEIGNVAFCAPTGKAANVLRDKGCYGASTIHSAMYRAAPGIDGQVAFTLNERSHLATAPLVISDEYSMQTLRVTQELKGLCQKVLFSGDPFQLAAVGNPNDLRPDVFLTQVQRQALDSGILRAATAVRQGQALKFCQQDDFTYVPERQGCPDWYLNADQILVGRNDTRRAFNRRTREIKGMRSYYPQTGDKLICLRNNPVDGVFNGMPAIASCDAEYPPGEKLKLWIDNGRSLDAWKGDFWNVEGGPEEYALNRFDYSYAMTVHKAQGSEFDDVLIYNQPIGRNAEECRRHLYTAITRGKKSVKVVEPGRGRF